MMNKIVMMALCLFAFLSLKATGLSGDMINIKGEEWVLLAKPINEDSLLYVRLMDFLPENRYSSTANWDGYTAYWKIENGNLYLQHIDVYLHNETRDTSWVKVFSPDDLKDVFASYYRGGKIYASWFSGQVRAGQGEQLIYIHSGFYRHYEAEQVITVENGRVLSMQLYHNYKKDGLKMESLYSEVVKCFPWQQFPEYRECKLYFTTHSYEVTPEGRLTDCYANVYIQPTGEKINDANHPLIKTFKEILKSIYPLEVFFINGKFILMYDNYTFPISVEKTKEANTKS